MEKKIRAWTHTYLPSSHPHLLTPKHRTLHTHHHHHFPHHHPLLTHYLPHAPFHHPNTPYPSSGIITYISTPISISKNRIFLHQTLRQNGILLRSGFHSVHHYQCCNTRYNFASDSFSNVHLITSSQGFHGHQ